jgi:hypothetical protein
MHECAVQMCRTRANKFIRIGLHIVTNKCTHRHSANQSCSGRRHDERGFLPKGQHLNETRKWRASNGKSDRILPPDSVRPSSASKTSRSARILDSANKSCSSWRRGRRRSLPKRYILTDTHAGHSKWRKFGLTSSIDMRCNHTCFTQSVHQNSTRGQLRVPARAAAAEAAAAAAAARPPHTS